MDEEEKIEWKDNTGESVEVEAVSLYRNTDSEESSRPPNVELENPMSDGLKMMGKATIFVAKTTLRIFRGTLKGIKAEFGSKGDK